MNDHTPVMGSIGMMMLDLNGLKYINGTMDTKPETE